MWWCWYCAEAKHNGTTWACGHFSNRQSSWSDSALTARLHLQVQTNPRLDWLSYVNESIKRPVISLSCLVSKSPRKEVMPLNREVAAILDQGQCFFYWVFCRGCYQRSGGKLLWEQNEREQNRQRQTERKKIALERQKLKNLLEVLVAYSEIIVKPIAL